MFCLETAEKQTQRPSHSQDIREWPGYDQQQSNQPKVCIHAQCTNRSFQDCTLCIIPMKILLICIYENLKYSVWIQAISYQCSAADNIFLVLNQINLPAPSLYQPSTFYTTLKPTTFCNLSMIQCKRSNEYYKIYACSPSLPTEKGKMVFYVNMYQIQII